MREENTENNQLKLNHTYEPDFEDNKAIPGVCSRWTRGWFESLDSKGKRILFVYECQWPLSATPEDKKDKS